MKLCYEIDRSIRGSVSLTQSTEIILPRKQTVVKVFLKTLPLLCAIEKEFIVDPPENCECCKVILTKKRNWSSSVIPFLAFFSPMLEIIVKSIDYGKRDPQQCIMTGDITHNARFWKSFIFILLKTFCCIFGIISLLFSYSLYLHIIELYDVLYEPNIFDSFPALAGSVQDQINTALLGGEHIGGAILTFLFWVITFSLYYLAERMRPQKISEVSLDEPFILYLRSFVADDQTSKSVDMLLSRGKSEEEETVDVFSEIAPVVAIGNPKDRNLPRGAARLYFSDDVWKQKVLEMLYKAKLVILRLGETSNFWWEVHNVLANCPLEKIIFLIPAMKTSETCQKLREICQETGITLPNITVDKSAKGSVSSVLYAENGTMKSQTLKLSKFTAFFISYKEMLKKVFQPVWTRLRFSTKKYHFVRYARIFAVLVLIFTFLLGASSILHYFQKRQELRLQARELVNDLRDYSPVFTESWPKAPSDKQGKSLFKQVQIGLIFLPDDEFYDCFKTLCGFIARKQISESLCNSMIKGTPSTDLFLQFMYAAKHTCSEERYQFLVQYLAKAADLAFMPEKRIEKEDTDDDLDEEIIILNKYFKQAETIWGYEIPIKGMLLSADGAQVLLEALKEIENKSLNVTETAKVVYFTVFEYLYDSQE